MSNSKFSIYSFCPWIYHAEKSVYANSLLPSGLTWFCCCWTFLCYACYKIISHLFAKVDVIPRPFTLYLFVSEIIHLEVETLLSFFLSFFEIAWFSFHGFYVFPHFTFHMQIRSDISLKCFKLVDCQRFWPILTKEKWGKNCLDSYKNVALNWFISITVTHLKSHFFVKMTFF